MVLVDTSVWIRAFSNRERYQQELDHLLADDDALGHELVFGELMIGDPGGRRRFLAAYSKMQYATPVAHSDVVAVVNQQKLYGRGVGWIDVHLLVSALAGRHQLWTADAKLQTIAEELGVAYQSRKAH